MQRINMESPTRRISIDELYHQLFWRVVITIASNEQATRGDTNPFAAVHLNDTIINTIIALSIAVENGDQDKIAQLQASAQTEVPVLPYNAGTSPQVDMKQRSILLYMNEGKRAPFWKAMIALGENVLSMRGRKSPFEAVNISALIVGAFLELGGHKISLDEQVFMPLAMKKTLTTSIPQEIRGEFWHKLLLLAAKKSVQHGGHSPFRGIDRSELVINLIIALAKTLRTKDIGDLLPLSEGNKDATVPDTTSFEEDEGGTTLVLSVHAKFRLIFWESMTTLGERELYRQSTDNPFRGVSASTIITNAVLAMGDVIGNGDWRRFSDLVGIAPPVVSVDVPVSQ